MGQLDPHHGIGTLVNHVAEGGHPYHAHLSPIYQTSTFGFPDVATGAAIFKGEDPGYTYTRLKNPNQVHIAEKYAFLEGLDLLRAHPEQPAGEIVAGLVFATGMAAITSAILARVRSGQTIIAQEALYGATFTFLHDIAPRYGIDVVWLHRVETQDWDEAFRAHPDAVMAYAETPANPTMAIVDLAAVAEIAHRHGAWLFVDNTFATPYCQRPLSLGADVCLHSTTKYLSGHGMIVGGAVVSRHPDWVQKELYSILKNLGGSASPFDCWLAAIGLKTFELRMQRHCENAMQVARFLYDHPKVAEVYYPGLESHPGYEIARRQMSCFGGMISFELKGGLAAGEAMLNRVRLMTLAVSLGNTDTLIQHPASMTHAGVPREERLKIGLTDGLVRLSVGIENVEDILDDLDQALQAA
jgi:methionine-gamma-lyase